MSAEEGDSKESWAKYHYHVEYATSARAKCTGPKPCNGTPIPKGGLRVGCIVDSRGYTTFAWCHWGCVPSELIASMKRSHSEADKLGGFDELREEDQDKIRKAWDVGHVADADIPETARNPDDDEHANGSKMKNKEKAVKRAKDDGDDNEPQKKKAKNAVGDNELTLGSSSSSISELDKILNTREVGSPGPSTSLPGNNLKPEKDATISESNVSASGTSSTGPTLVCRLCSLGAKQPTVTTCGHLFCHDCIIGELSKHLRCPVCQAIMLVHLQMEK